jgi:heptaprenyl diphosphate synthase
MRIRTEKLDVVAFLAALSLFLSTVEYVIPKPVPFLRLGLANLPLLISLTTLPVPQLLALILLKVVGQALIHGSLFSYVFLLSLCGSLTGGAVMILAARLPRKSISLIGISILGALASNTAQLLLAVSLVFGANGWLIAPPLLGVGLVSSTAIGILAERFVRTSRWIREMRGAE